VVKLRLARFGSKKNPIYRIVVQNDASPRNGRAIENIGRYNPQLEPSLIEINEERAKYWLANGAQPSQPVHRLLQKQGII
jgi:small subunit ribosomal protein S16